LVHTDNQLDVLGSFNVHGILYVEDEQGHIAPVESEIRQLAAGLQGIKDEQEYIVVRERVHRDSKHVLPSF
jgi:ribosomal protein L15E